MNIKADQMERKIKENMIICLLRSINYERYLQRVKKSLQSLFVDKRWYINET